MTQNLFDDLPLNLPEELIDVLVDSPNVRIERIVSTGHCSADEFWYDQVDHEWVIVLRGKARLMFEGEPELHHLRAGDHMMIPAHQKHRVEWTTPDEPTVWLAVFFGE